MGSFSAIHWIIIILVVVVIFGAGRLPSAMADLAKGIKAFRSGMKDEQQQAEQQRTATVTDAAKPAAPQGAPTTGTTTGQPG